MPDAGRRLMKWDHSLIKRDCVDRAEREDVALPREALRIGA